MENNGFISEETGEKTISKIGALSSSSSNSSVAFKVEEGITFSWSNLTVSTKEKSTGKCCGLFNKETIPSKHILKNVSGIVRPGELLAIMGASGAGKSTLLNTLLFRNLGDLQVSGKRIANNSIVTPNSLTALSGYVQQVDLFFGTLTVQEHLKFQAMVRMDKEIPMAKRMERVDEVIKVLGLTKAKDTVIGIPGRIKGISGGEMKRLSFASEVLTNPPILFCDEPTSGLDSFMAASVMDMMMDLAKQGRTVICTIHQPSSQIFAKFDRLLLLAEGRTAYLGDASQAATFFQSVGKPCPSNYNPADHFVEVLAIQPGKEEECKKEVDMICTSFDDSKDGMDLLAELKQEESTVTDSNQNKSDNRSPYKASWGAQFKALTWRNFLAMIKEPLLVKVRIIQAIVIAIILGVIYLGQDLDQDGIQNANGALFVVITNMSFANIFAVVNVFCNELPIFLREHFNGMYRVDTYYLTRQLVDMPLFILEPTIFLAVLYFMVGLNPAVDRFFMAVLIVLLVVQVVVSLGYFMSCSAPNVEIALAISPVIIIPFMLFGGFYLNTGDVGWLVWLKYLSWFQYGFSALMINQWDGVENISCNIPNLVNNSTEMAGGAPGPISCITTGEQVLQTLSFEKEDFAFDLIMLVVLSLALRILAFISLYLKARKK